MGWPSGYPATPHREVRHGPRPRRAALIPPRAAPALRRSPFQEKRPRAISCTPLLPPLDEVPAAALRRDQVMHRQFRTACSRSTSSPVSVGARTHESFPRPRPVLLGALLALLLLGAASAQALAVSKRQVSTHCNTPCKDPSIPCYTSFSSAISARPSLGPGDTLILCRGKYYQKA